MNSSEVQTLLSSASSYEVIRDVLRHVSEGEVFPSLYPIAIESELKGPASEAAQLLCELNPTCQLSCYEAVYALLQHWDISIEEVPFYLFKQFGMKQLSDVIEQLKLEALTEEQRVRLETVTYWVTIASEEELAHVDTRL